MRLLLISPHCSMIPIDAGTKKRDMFFVRKSATGLTSSALIIFAASAAKSNTIPHTLPGIKFPSICDAAFPNARKPTIINMPFKYIICFL